MYSPCASVWWRTKRPSVFQQTRSRVELPIKMANISPITSLNTSSNSCEQGQPVAIYGGTSMFSRDHASIAEDPMSASPGRSHGRFREGAFGNGLAADGETAEHGTKPKHDAKESATGSLSACRCSARGRPPDPWPADPSWRTCCIYGQTTRGYRELHY